MSDNFEWDKFYKSGKVIDYLKYKQKQGGTDNANNGKRLSSEGTGIWRK